MAMRMVKSPSREDGSAGCHAGPDAVPGLNGHRAAALGPETGTNWPELSSSGPAEQGTAFALTLRLDRMARQTAGLAQRVEELETELKQRGRRIQQLMGERDELRSLVARRDLELSRLNREIGAIEARSGPAAGRPPVSFAAARRLLDMLGRARAGLRRPDPGSLRRSQPDGRTERLLVPWIKDRPPKEVLAVVLFGLSEAQIEAVLGVVERYCTEREIAPLLLTDHDSFELFRTRRVLFEFLPPRSEQQRNASDLDWRLYTQRRLALIRRKWRPSRVVAFGRQATEVVRLWLDSPFEATPIAASLKCGSALDQSAWEAAQVSA